MGYDYFWGDNDSDGQAMAKARGLKSPQPIMCSSRESDHSMYMFQSSNEYYLWDPSVGDSQAGTQIAEAYGGTPVSTSG
jgi:hypothetical protein